MSIIISNNDNLGSWIISNYMWKTCTSVSEIRGLDNIISDSPNNTIDLKALFKFTVQTLKNLKKDKTHEHKYE